MTKDIERERKAFEERFQHLDLDFVDDLGYCESETQIAWASWCAAKAHEAKKLEGCVVVPESEYNDLAQFKDLYRRAIVNAKKRKNQINWAHVSGLGVGSGRAVDLCKELKIDPHATDMNVMLEAARGGNE